MRVREAHLVSVSFPPPRTTRIPRMRGSAGFYYLFLKLLSMQRMRNLVHAYSSCVRSFPWFIGSVVPLQSYPVLYPMYTHHRYATPRLLFFVFVLRATAMSNSTNLLMGLHQSSLHRHKHIPRFV